MVQIEAAAQAVQGGDLEARDLVAHGRCRGVRGRQDRQAGGCHAGLHRAPAGLCAEFADLALCDPDDEARRADIGMQDPARRVACAARLHQLKGNDGLPLPPLDALLGMLRQNRLEALDTFKTLPPRLRQHMARLRFDAAAQLLTTHAVQPTPG